MRPPPPPPPPPQGEDAALYLKVGEATNRQAFNHGDQHQGELSPRLIFHFKTAYQECGYRSRTSQKDPHLHPSTLHQTFWRLPASSQHCFFSGLVLPSFSILHLTAFSARPRQISSLFSAVIALQHVWPHRPSSPSVSSHYLSSVLSLSLSSSSSLLMLLNYGAAARSSHAVTPLARRRRHAWNTYVCLHVHVHAED